MRTLLKRSLVVFLFTIVATMLASGTAMAEKKYPWAKEPGPIAGKWKTTCPNSAGMVIEFTMAGDKKAVGRIAEVGAASKYGYKHGEEIFRVSADDFGEWVGQLKWRSVAGAERWDPIRLVASPDRLNAAMTTDDCYKNMPRVK
jgi:hypothetical protein